MKTVIFLAFLTVTVFAQNNLREIVNPYAHINWETFEHHKANLHAHTSQSDGDFTVAEVIDMYHNAGYTILSITENDAIGANTFPITWPWTDFGRDPVALGMLAIKGHEISLGPHVGSYFNDFPGLTNNINTTMAEIENRNGLAILCHPGRNRFSLFRYESYYNNFPALIGMEIVTELDPYPGDRDLWDDKLSVLMPQRPVWGFAADDMHTIEHFNTNWTVFVIPELTEEHVRNAMENGVFFSSSRVTVANAVGEPPVVRRVLHDATAGTVTIEAEGYDIISWRSANRADVAVGNSINYMETPNISRYFRATLTGPGGQTFVQPFAVFEDGVSVKEIDDKVLDMKLSVYPNPFNPVANVLFSVAQSTHAVIEVVDIKGRVVSRLKDGLISSGSRSIVFDASHLPSGVYFVRFSANNNVKQQKILFVK